MIRIRTNRNGWRDIYLSPVASSRLLGSEPDQSNPNYVADGIVFCRLAVSDDKDRREESVWLMLDAASAGVAVSSSLLSTFVGREALDLAEESLKDRTDAVKHAERELANLAARIELPTRVPDRSAHSVRVLSEPTRIITGLLVANLIVLALVPWLLLKTWDQSGGINLSDALTQTIQQAIAKDIARQQQLQQAATQKAVSEIIKTSLQPEVEERGREQLQLRLLRALDAIRGTADGWNLKDEELAKRLAERLAQQK